MAKEIVRYPSASELDFPIQHNITNRHLWLIGVVVELYPLIDKMLDSVTIAPWFSWINTGFSSYREQIETILFYVDTDDIPALFPIHISDSIISQAADMINNYRTELNSYYEEIKETAEIFRMENERMRLTHYAEWEKAFFEFYKANWDTSASFSSAVKAFCEDDEVVCKVHLAAAMIPRTVHVLAAHVHHYLPIDNVGLVCTTCGNVYEDIDYAYGYE